MTLTSLQKAPFPWFGGKRRAAPAVWDALGDPYHYVEPFAGSLAVLLERPHKANRTYYSETVNDIDGLLVNFWRAVQWYPQETAEAASWPVAEFDKHARSVALTAWRESESAARLAGDATWCDPIMAGWWVWCVSVQIGAWGQGGPWWPDETGRLRRRPRSAGVDAKLPHLSNNGQGAAHGSLRAEGLGVPAALPHLVGDGQGVNRPQGREPGLGVWTDLPHLANNGRGVNRPQAREPGLGVPAALPHLSDDGQAVNRPALRAEGLGITAGMVHMPNDRGVAHFQTRAEGLGVPAALPHLSDNGQGAAHGSLRAEGLGDPPAAPPGDPDGFVYHPLTMPELRRWFGFLSARLRHVRIVNGDWSRVLTTGAAWTLSVRQKPDAYAGVFLDPPYGDVGRASLYGRHESLTVAEEVRAWALAHGGNRRWRIVYAGFDEEGADLEAAGWTPVEWFTEGYLTGGLGNQNAAGHQQHRERLWLSPHCAAPGRDEPAALF